MADTSQNLKNHARLFPPFHLFVLPVLLINVFVAAWRTYRAPSLGTAWGIVIAAAFVMLALTARTMALTVQDRVIRLEMRLRLMGILPADLQNRVGDLTRQQLIALRFASDAELPGLVRDALGGRLQTPKAIKEQIKEWQPDYLRC